MTTKQLRPESFCQKQTEGTISKTADFQDSPISKAGKFPRQVNLQESSISKAVDLRLELKRYPDIIRPLSPPSAFDRYASMAGPSVCFGLDLGLIPGLSRACLGTGRINGALFGPRSGFSP
jgi:hypothetical protein